MKQFSYHKALLAILCIAGLVFSVASCKSNDVAANRAACEADSNCNDGDGVDDNAPVKFIDFETGSSGLTQSSDSNVAWLLLTSSNSYQGSWSYRSGAIGLNQKSCFQTNGSYSRVDFAYYTNTRSGFHYLKFYVNDSLKFSFSGLNSWNSKRYDMSATNSTFKWCYVKDGNSASGSDLVQVDNISFYK